MRFALVANNSGNRRVPVFPIALAALALLAFGQLLVAGLALGARFAATRQEKVVTKEVVRVVAVPTGARPQADTKTAGPVVLRPPAAAPQAETPLPPPRPMTSPVVADPRTEGLLGEARQARLGGDLARAILKLEEAKSRSPDDATLLFELGQTHEALGVFDTASDYYEKVMRMGTGGAGDLFAKAAAKLRDGFLPDNNLGKVRLGTVAVFKGAGNDPAGSGRVTLTIPVRIEPGVEMNPEGDIQVGVEIFNRSKRDGSISAAEKSWTSNEWLPDTQSAVPGEGCVRFSYEIPGSDPATEHLFGELEYYGYVISLSFKGEIVDIDSAPRSMVVHSHLLSEENARASSPHETLPADPGVGVLPAP